MSNKKIPIEELTKILMKHKAWLNREEGGIRADLRDADLRGADLRDADLRGADLSYADLSYADLNYADLSSADLSYADLSSADLRDADLRDADLSYADLSYTIIFMPLACPEEGSFIGFKKAGKYIIKLKIPNDALRSSATSRKCRCSKAEVLSITNLDGTICGITCVHSDYDSNFIYTVGETVEVSDFDTNRWNECSTGIHFFITRREAVKY